MPPFAADVDDKRSRRAQRIHTLYFVSQVTVVSPKCYFEDELERKAFRAPPQAMS